jgi:LPXTG-motif cell wall-anchored protein
MSTLTLTLAGILLIGGILLMRARRHGKYPSIPGLT